MNIRPMKQQYRDALMMAPSALCGHKKSPLACFMEQSEWTQGPLQHCWNFGYHSHTIMKIMNSLPWKVTTPLKRLSDMLHRIAEESFSKLKTLSLEVQYAGDEYGYKLLSPAISENWDEETDYGLIQIEFDTELQTRDSVAVNRRASHFWGLTKEDLMDRFEKNQVPLQMTELDWVRVFSVYLSRFFSDSVAQYLRFTLGAGKASRCALVCMTTLKKFNQFGRISQPRRGQLLILSSVLPFSSFRVLTTS